MLRVATAATATQTVGRSKMDRPEEPVDVICKLLPNGGNRFLLRDAAQAMERFYALDRLDDYDEDAIVVVATRCNKDRRFDIGFYRSFGMFTQLEVLLRFPLGLRCLMLRTVNEFCDSTVDAPEFFSSIRASRWYRRYAFVAPDSCHVRWRGESEMEEAFCEFVPKLIAALGPDL